MTSAEARPADHRPAGRRCRQVRISEGEPDPLRASEPRSAAGRLDGGDEARAPTRAAARYWGMYGQSRLPSCTQRLGLAMLVWVVVQVVVFGSRPRRVIGLSGRRSEEASQLQ